MLQPKRTKYRRPQRLSYEGLTKGGANIEFGEFGLQALEGAYITNRQIESARIVLASYTRRVGKIWIRIFPHLAKTKKPLEVRMGSGKGAPDSWVAVVKKNRILFEIGGVKEEIAREALRLAAYKLPIKTRVVSKADNKED
ncbi:MAG: 50S ribosomal protein L16 [Bacilli bacterium]|jgi:large subunit ribosomal protein L16|nr:50S ribosomal protein L16 [Bacillota bacterium]NLI51796.1 50S ribosomal protein L16 [Erysipelotrichaceae bacterium]OQC49603.1 MAG: 50S ribosomal protein L16 [Tenericutes bacterium ADurb.Bin024]HOH94815.1 50S ribosomal protein L16 [Bacilli bacterium]TAH59506.1 MAG: 50S ribosomal protein L16 [Bacillota bacterium]